MALVGSVKQVHLASKGLSSEMMRSQSDEKDITLTTLGTGAGPGLDSVMAQDEARSAGPRYLVAACSALLGVGGGDLSDLRRAP